MRPVLRNGGRNPHAYHPGATDGFQFDTKFEIVSPVLSPG